MTTRFVLLGLLFAAPAALPAQRLTLGADVGGSSASSDLAGTAGWKSGWSAGANLTYKLGARLGVRADANFSQNDLSGGVAVPGEQRFNKIAYMGDAVWQFAALRGTRLAPYALAGVGAVRVHDKGSDSSFTQFAGNFGLGVGYRLGKVGLRAEGRDLLYKFNHFGYNRSQTDFIYQAGLTVGL
jgi:opacity protein-like surface antigen